MAWETEGTGTRVVSVQNGSETAHNFDGSRLLKDVVKDVASKMGFGTVLVEADGSEVEQNRGNDAISSFGTIKITPKMSGA